MEKAEQRRTWEKGDTTWAKSRRFAMELDLLNYLINDLLGECWSAGDYWGLLGTEYWYL